jgi:hypothetical protein
MDKADDDEEVHVVVDVVGKGRIEAGEKAMTPEPAAMKADNAAAADEETIFCCFMNLYLLNVVHEYSVVVRPTPAMMMNDGHLDLLSWEKRRHQKPAKMNPTLVIV